MLRILVLISLVTLSQVSMGGNLTDLWVLGPVQYVKVRQQEKLLEERRLKEAKDAKDAAVSLSVKEETSRRDAAREKSQAYEEIKESDRELSRLISGASMALSQKNMDILNEIAKQLRTQKSLVYSIGKLRNLPDHVIYRLVADDYFRVVALTKARFFQFSNVETEFYEATLKEIKARNDQFKKTISELSQTQSQVFTEEKTH